MNVYIVFYITDEGSDTLVDVFASEALVGQHYPQVLDVASRYYVVVQEVVEE